MQSFLQATLPADAQQATLVGRVWIEGKGPVLVRADHQSCYDLSQLASTSSALMELPDPAAAVRAHDAPRIASVAEVIANSHADQVQRIAADQLDAAGAVHAEALRPLDLHRQVGLPHVGDGEASVEQPDEGADGAAGVVVLGLAEQQRAATLDVSQVHVIPK